MRLSRSMIIAIDWIDSGYHFRVTDPDTIDGPCQIFRDTDRVAYDIRRGVPFERRLEIAWRELEFRHTTSIAHHLIYSVPGHYFDHPDDLRGLRLLYGFQDRVGRLPEIGDKCSLGYLGNRFFQKTEGTSWEGGNHEIELLSEVCLHIDELATGEDPMDFMYKPALDDVSKAMVELSRMKHNPFVPGGGDE